MTLTEIRNSIVEHVTEAGKQLDGEYHKALTSFLDFIERKNSKLAEAVTLLKANGYTVTLPEVAAAVEPVVAVATPVVTQ
jgi:hypothetical protein